MDELSELREKVQASDPITRQRFLRYVELRQEFAELTGSRDLDEATPMLGLLYEQHPRRREIVLTAGRLRILGRLVFSKLT